MNNHLHPLDLVLYTRTSERQLLDEHRESMETGTKFITTQETLDSYGSHGFNVATCSSIHSISFADSSLGKPFFAGRATRAAVIAMRFWASSPGQQPRLNSTTYGSLNGRGNSRKVFWHLIAVRLLYREVREVRRLYFCFQFFLLLLGSEKQWRPFHSTEQMFYGSSALGLCQASMLNADSFLTEFGASDSEYGPL